MAAANTGKKNTKGQYKYKILPEYFGGFIWHNREDGGMELARKVLNTILGKWEE